MPPNLTGIIRLSLLVLGLLGIGVAKAADGDAVASQMLRCLKLPDHSAENVAMVAQIAFKQGSAEFVSINFSAPPTEWEKVVAPAISDAVTDCEPYGDISGQVTFSITPELLNSRKK